MVFKVKKAFTLAEVLVALTIIGIVAAMTIPSIMQSTQEAELKSAYKKAYSEMSQAVMKMAQDNGGDLSAYNGAARSFKPDYIKYFDIIKDCSVVSCVPSISSSDIYKTYNGNPANTALFDDGQFVLKNGMTVMIENTNGGNIYISVDVNGHQKSPNVWGKDIITFHLLNNRLVPMGAANTSITNLSTYCSSSSSSYYNGIACAAQMLQQ